MKLLYVINSLSFGGAEKNLYQIVSMMVNKGHSVMVVALFKDNKSDAVSMYDNFYEKTKDIVFLDSHGISDFGRWLSLYKIIKELQPDLIHSHLPRSDLAVSICKLFIPSLVWVSTYHDRYKKDTYSGYWIYYLVWPLLRMSTHYIAVSKVVEEWLIGMLHINKNRVSTIYHGVEVKDDLASLDSSEQEGMTIGCLARYEYRKGATTLISAMVDVAKKFPDAKLLLAGSDPSGYSSTLQKLINCLGLQDNVTLIGFSGDPIGFIDSLDIFAYASITEGFGIVLIEAMSRGCPIVASDISPINDIVVDGDTGILVDVDSSSDFANALISLLKDSKKRKILGEAGLKRCKSEFTLEASLEQVYKVYKLCYDKKN